MKPQDSRHWPLIKECCERIARGEDPKIRVISSDTELRFLAVSLAEHINYELVRPTITVNGIEVPAPETVAPPVGTRYWAVDLGSENFAIELICEGDDTDRLLLARGLVHLAEANAVAHGKAMCGVKE